MALLVLVVLAGAVLGWVACSDGDPGGAPAATSPTSEPLPTTTVQTTGTGPAPGTSPATPDSPPTVAMAEGWRFAATDPQPGATVGRSITLCTEIIGTSREPVLEIKATLARQGGPDSTTSRVDVDVGRDSAVLEFPKAAPGRYDLELRLNVDGRWISRLRVTIPDVRVAADTPPGDCG